MEVVSITPDKVVLKATNGPQEARDLANVAGFDEKDTVGLVGILTGKTTEFVLNSTRDMKAGNGGFVSVIVSSDYIQPYLDRLKKITGMGVFPSPVMLKSLNGAFHTHLVDSAILNGEELRVLVVNPTYNFIGMRFKDEAERFVKAESDALHKINSRIGQVETEREFIEAGNGFYKRNKNYATSSKSYISKLAVYENLWQEIFGIWVQGFATEGQKAVLARISRFRGQKEQYPTLLDREGLHLDGYTTMMKFEEFQKQ